jgi:hypothetical protein
MNLDQFREQLIKEANRKKLTKRIEMAIKDIESVKKSCETFQPMGEMAQWSLDYMEKTNLQYDLQNNLQHNLQEEKDIDYALTSHWQKLDQKYSCLKNEASLSVEQILLRLPGLRPEEINEVRDIVSKMFAGMQVGMQVETQVETQCTNDFFKNPEPLTECSFERTLTFPVDQLLLPDYKEFETSQWMCCTSAKQNKWQIVSQIKLKDKHSKKKPCVALPPGVIVLLHSSGKWIYLTPRCSKKLSVFVDFFLHDPNDSILPMTIAVLLKELYNNKSH